MMYMFVYIGGGGFGKCLCSFFAPDFSRICILSFIIIIVCDQLFENSAKNIDFFKIEKKIIKIFFAATF